ncbi:MAG TPA: hypothetical protein VFJ29_06710, partial [Candidatus Kapabacteria bacterium]|nr:hypothetical protein [Candidatus Kapabacteria bacterium]
ELHWRGDDEFEYQGRLYDVSHSFHQHNTTFYYCVNDTKEESLVANVNEHVKQHTGDADNQSRDSKIALKNIVQYYFCNNSLSSSSQERSEYVAFELSRTCIFLQPEIPTPPPKA